MSKLKQVAVPVTDDEQQSQAYRSIVDIIEDLSMPIDDRFLRTKEARSRKENTTQQLLYVPWYNAVAILDDIAPGWHYEIRSVLQIGTNLVMTVRISIPCLEGIVCREASALEPITGTGFGDAATNAESAALRRAAAKFGLGLYLYDKDVARRAVRQFQRGATQRVVSDQRQQQQNRQQMDQSSASAPQHQERASERPTKPEPQAAGGGGGDDREFNCPLGLVDAYNKAVAALDAASVTKAEWRAKVREVLGLEADAHLDMRDLDGSQMSKAVNALNALAKAAKTATAGAR